MNSSIFGAEDSEGRRGVLLASEDCEPAFVTSAAEVQAIGIEKNFIAHVLRRNPHQRLLLAVSIPPSICWVYPGTQT